MTAKVQLVEDGLLNADNMPFNEAAEAALLGALMIENSLVGMVAWLPPEAFWITAHQVIYRAIISEVARGAVANPVTLRPLLHGEPLLANVGGAAYLAELTGNTAALIGARDFANQILELYQRRQLATALHESLKAALDTANGQRIEALVESVDEAVNASALAVKSHAKHEATLNSAWDAMLARYDKIVTGELKSGLQVDGLDDFNDLTGGLKDGDLIVVAGRPGMGKTAFAVTLASATARAGIGTAFYSLEMSIEQLIERQVSDLCYTYHGVPFSYHQLKHGHVATPELRRMQEVRDECASWPLYYDDTADMRVGHLIGKIRRRKRLMEAKGTPLKVVIIDYLGLLKADNDYRGNKVNEVSEITRSLKVAAKDMGIAVILLCQLSRATEQRENKRPQLSDLRDSGAIEQDADAVLFVYREEYYLKAEEPPKNGDAKAIAKWDKWHTDLQAARDRMDLIAAKVRGGETGVRKCYFYGAHQAVRSSNFHKENF